MFFSVNLQIIQYIITLQESSKSDPFEFPKENLVFEHLLDEGNFGKVYCAKAFGLSNKENHRLVAVKQLKGKETQSSTTINNLYIMLRCKCVFTRIFWGLNSRIIIGKKILFKHILSSFSLLKANILVLLS